MKKKINRHAFSGGKEDLKTHRLEGGNPDVDISFQYMKFLMPDDKKLFFFEDEYRSGRMTSGEMKQECINVLIPILENFQQRRAAITDEKLKEYMFKN